MNNQEKILQNAVFWVDIDKVLPNPYQPRKDFNQEALNDLADSIRQYGILQPLTVSRREDDREDGGFSTMYELIAGERRLRASKIAGLRQVPVIIRVGDDNQTKLELAIIENLQREDLNPIDRAKAFSQLVNEFAFKHGDVAKKMGKSREYVSNSMRLLMLPTEIQEALSKGKISEGHTRPLLMLTDKPTEQMTLFREMLIRKMTVREAEGLARKVAQDKVRKKAYIKDPNILEIETDLAQKLGTRVHIEKRDVGGVITIDFFSFDDLSTIVGSIQDEKKNDTNVATISMSDKLKNAALAMGVQQASQATSLENIQVAEEVIEENLKEIVSTETPDILEDDRGTEEARKDDDAQDDELYNIKNFVI
jgi:ParB family transcriptional regulator, chromosome partitioning protein